MFTLLPQHVAKSYWKDWATSGGKGEPRGFFWSVSKIRGKIVLEKTKLQERELNDLEEKTSKLASRVTAALVINEEHMSDYHTTLKLKSNKAWAKNQSKDTRGKNLLFTGARWMHPCNVLEWKQIHWKNMTAWLTRNDEVYRRARMEKRTRREAKWKTTDKTRPKSEKSSCSIYRWSCSRWWRSQCHRFNALPFVMER